MDCKKGVMLVAFHLVMCSTKVKTDDGLVCPVKEWGIAGENVSFQCLSNIPLMYITLTKINNHVKNVSIVTVNSEGRLYFYDESKGMENRLKVKADMPKGKVDFTFDNVIPRDSGLYVISYKTEKDLLDQKSTLLVKILVPPTISGCENRTFVEGDTGSLSCNISGSQPLTTTWYRGNTTWTGNNPVLPVIRRDDQGWYKVVSTNRMENKTFYDVKEFYLTVLFKPDSPIMTFQTNKTVFYKQEKIYINCRAAANPPAVFSFYFNNKLVQNNSRNEGKGTHSISTFAVKLARTGLNTFRCVPFNKVGIGQNQSSSIFVQDNVKKPANSRVKLEIILPVIGCLVLLLGGVAIWLRRKRKKELQLLLSWGRKLFNDRQDP